MDAYLVVESPVRRKLEEMLQTWKQPVPGSTSSQPVFASEITRKIDNALIKARTAALQQQQKQMRQNQALGLDRQPAGRTPPPQQFRNTPPPPPPMGNGNTPAYTNGHGFDFGRSASGTPPLQNGNQRNSNLNPYNTSAPQSAINMSASAGIQQLSLQGPPPHSGGNVDTLQSDISRLIDSCQTSVARDPRNLELQSRLQALIDLRGILQTQQLPQEQLVTVRDQVRALANPTPPPVAMPQPPPPPPPPQMLPLSTQDLASLLATATQGMPFPPVPQPMPMALPVSLPQAPILPPPPPPPAASFGGDNGMDPASLFAALQKSGLLANLPPPPPVPTAGAPLPFPLPLPGSLPRNMMTPPTYHIPPANSGKRDWRSIDVEMKSTSLKM